MANLSKSCSSTKINDKKIVLKYYLKVMKRDIKSLSSYVINDINKFL